MDYVVFENVTYTYPASEKPAIRNVSFTIQKGDFVAIIGKNGSGKTTVCNAIRGFIPHFYNGRLKGKIMLKGRDVTQTTVGEMTLDAGYVFQNPFSQTSGTKTTVFEEIGYGLENTGVERMEIIRRVRDVIELLDIEHLQFKVPSELSGGQRQRVSLASIIVMEPDILIIDEPTSQLDPKGTNDVFKIIKTMKERGKTIILVEHKIDLVAEYANRVLLMDEGKILRDGTTREVLTDEVIETCGTVVPQYVKIGFALQNQGLPIEQVPITLDEAAQAVRACL